MIYGMLLLPYKYRGPYAKKGGLLTTTGKRNKKNKEELLLLLEAVWEPAAVAVMYPLVRPPEGEHALGKREPFG